MRQIEFEGAPLRMMPKLDYVQQKIEDRHAKVCRSLPEDAHIVLFVQAAINRKATPRLRCSNRQERLNTTNMEFVSFVGQLHSADNSQARSMFMTSFHREIVSSQPHRLVVT